MRDNRAAASHPDCVLNVLLVGEDRFSLRFLLVDIAQVVASVRLVSDVEALAAAIEEHQPDLIVFDHVEPMDVFLLNPRDRGYAGPLILLVTDSPPEPLVEHLQNPEIIKKAVAKTELIARLRITGR